MAPTPKKIQIPVHVAVWTVVFAPGVAYAYYWYKNAPTNEEFEEKLRENYSHNITNSREKHAQMNAVFASMRDPTIDDQKKMNEILMGGRDKQKRLYSVDESIYGTEEGKASLEVAEREMKKAERLRKKKNKKKGIDNNKTVDDSSAMTSGVDSFTVIKSSAIVVTCLGLVAVGASLFLGGNKRS